jgi:hypothetical protein
VDKRKRWREEEERLVARWNAAALRYREVQAEISSQGAETEALKLKAQTAREEIEAVRREVARLKVEFNSGKRY